LNFNRNAETGRTSTDYPATRPALRKQTCPITHGELYFSNTLSEECKAIYDSLNLAWHGFADVPSTPTSWCSSTNQVTHDISEKIDLSVGFALHEVGVDVFSTPTSHCLPQAQESAPPSILLRPNFNVDSGTDFADQLMIQGDPPPWESKLHIPFAFTTREIGILSVDDQYPRKHSGIGINTVDWNLSIA
jgi:hypothetical protein